MKTKSWLIERVRPVFNQLLGALLLRSPQGRGRGMAFPVLVAFGFTGLLATATPSEAQVGGVYWQCVAPSTANPQGAYCPVNTSYPLPTAESGAAVGGGSTYRSVALTNTALAVKATAGTVSFLHVANLESMAVTCYVHLYNVAAASVIVGTTVPIWSMVLGAGTIQTVPFSVPITFSAAIAAAATTTAGGSTACSPILTLTEIVYK